MAKCVAKCVILWGAMKDYPPQHIDRFHEVLQRFDPTVSVDEAKLIALWTLNSNATRVTRMLVLSMLVNQLGQHAELNVQRFHSNLLALVEGQSLELLELIKNKVQRDVDPVSHARH